MFYIDIVTYALSKKYTDKTAEGLGALKGADCIVKSITENDDNVTVTFEWTGTGGTKETSVMTVPKGEDGVSVSNAYIDENQELIIELSDGTEKNAGQLPVMKNAVDTELSDTSENPIANKTVSAELKKLTETIGDEAAHHMSITQEEYDKLSEEEKNNGTVYFITDGMPEDIENTKVTAESIGLGNVENKSSETIRSEITKENITNALGYTPPTTDDALTSAKEYTNGKIADLINGSPETLDTLGEIAQAINDNKTVVETLNTAIGTKANTSDLTAHTGNKNNPHSVTKTQVGLENVPNVTTNDQTPTYSDTTTFATLSSGEKISVAFAKIKLAISNLISHISNTSNPHSVTKSQVGLGNVENKSSATIRAELTKDNVTTALGYIPPKNDTVYTLPSATSSVLGGVKTGDNITNTSGTISLSKDNVTSALGYTPTTIEDIESAVSAIPFKKRSDLKKNVGHSGLTFTIPQGAYLMFYNCYSGMYAFIISLVSGNPPQLHKLGNTLGVTAEAVTTDGGSSIELFVPGQLSGTCLFYEISKS